MVTESDLTPKQAQILGYIRQNTWEHPWPGHKPTYTEIIEELHCSRRDIKQAYEAYRNCTSPVPVPVPVPSKDCTSPVPVPVPVPAIKALSEAAKKELKTAMDQRLDCKRMADYNHRLALWDEIYKKLVP